MLDLIVIAGAPGTGKTTIADLLHRSLGSPYIDFGNIREFHLDREWKDENVSEEQMSFENLVYIVKNYFYYGYSNVILTDLKDFRVRQIPEIFADREFLIATLFVMDDQELERRISERNEGFRDTKRAIEWNRQVQERQGLRGELFVNNSHNDPHRTHDLILDLVTGK